ncbi:hypothetical protein RFI_13184, partial [Reticulomyxa filosa]
SRQGALEIQSIDIGSNMPTISSVRYADKREFHIHNRCTVFDHGNTGKSRKDPIEHLQQFHPNFIFDCNDAQWQYESDMPFAAQCVRQHSNALNQESTCEHAEFHVRDMDKSVMNKQEERQLSEMDDPMFIDVHFRWNMNGDWIISAQHLKLGGKFLIKAKDLSVDGRVRFTFAQFSPQAQLDPTQSTFCPFQLIHVSLLSPLLNLSINIDVDKVNVNSIGKAIGIDITKLVEF